MTNISWWVENVTEAGFIIAINSDSVEALQFNWRAIATKNNSETISEPVKPVEPVEPSEPVIENEEEIIEENDETTTIEQEQSETNDETSSITDNSITNEEETIVEEDLEVNEE